MTSDALGRIPRHCAFWAKKRPVNSDRWLRTLLSQYLDESTKSPAADPSPEVKEPLLPGRDYTPFSSGVWVFGHVANRVAQAGLSPAFGQPREVIAQVADWWAHDRADAATKAHHVIASFDPRIATELHRRGYPVDAMLLASIHQTLSQYAARFYPGETLGWVAGCHHDTEVPHAHVLLHPETSGGRLLRTSGKKDGEVGDDRFEFLRLNFNTRARQLYVALTLQPEPSAETERLSASQFMTLAYHAWNTAGPDAMDAPAAATALLKDWAASREYPNVLQEAVQSAEAAFHTMGGTSLDPVGVKANFDQVQEGFDEARSASLEAGLAAIRVFADGRSSADSYRPVTSPIAPPGVPLSSNYYQLAGRSTDKKVSSLEAAFLARREASDRQRVRFNEALKAYRAAMEQSQAALDQAMLRSANGALRVATIASAATGSRPAHLNVGVAPGRPVPRAVPSPQKLDSYVEREMGNIATIEADAHQPENPEAVPSLLASHHRPRIREMAKPTVIPPLSGPIL